MTFKHKLSKRLALLRDAAMVLPAAALLACALRAEMLAILTNVEKVQRDFGKPTAQPLDRVSISEVGALIAENQFSPGSMLPKIEAALDFLATQPAHLIVLDIRMPAMNGIDFLEAYRQIAPIHAPVIMVSALRGIVPENLPTNGTFLSKPFTPSALRNAAAEFLS